MENSDFYKNIISLLIRSDIRFRETTVRPVKYDEKENITVSMFCEEVLNFGQTPLSKTPAISCLIVFTLFDAYIENKYNMGAGMSFRNKYNNIPITTNQNIVEKECYRVMKTIRNGFVHNINAIITENNSFHFNYISPQGTNFNLDISSDKLELLYSIILLLVKGRYEVNTKGHFENVICTYYNDLREYIDEFGNFTDDGDIGSGTTTAFDLMPISTDVKFNTIVRYPVENPVYDISGGRVRIETIYNTGCEFYSADYCIIYNEKKYLVPQEVLDESNSVPISELSIWEYTI